MMPSTAPRGLGGDSSKKVAIIVVHGVSDQQPYDSARTIANLLLHANEEQPRYSVWIEQFIRIPVRRIPKCQDSEACGQPEAASSSKRLLSWLFGWLDERGERIRRYLDSEDPSNANQTIEEKSHAFTCDFIEYDGSPKDLEASFYNTICLKACRDDQHEVHLYEMYWADLSRLGRGFVQIFSEFYQILFHLSALGRHTLDMAALEHPGILWRVYSSLHGWAGRILSIPIPLLSLFLLVAAFFSLPGNIKPPYSSYLASVTLTIWLIALMGWLLWRNAKKLPLTWLVLPVVTGLLLAIMHSFLMNFSYKALAAEWLFVLAILVGMLIKQYSLRRPGAGKVAVGLGLPLAAFALWNLFVGVENSHRGITKVSFKLIEVIYSLLVVSWVSFFGFYFLVVILGYFAQVRLTDKNAKERAKRASWTASVSLWIPSISFISVTIALWTALAQVGSSLLPKDYPYSPTPWFKNWLSLEEIYKRPYDFFNEITVDPVFGLAVLSSVIVLLLMAWSFLPSVWAEIEPPDSTPQPSHPKFDELSLNFGIWLNNGYRAVYSFIPLVSAIFIFFVVSYFLLLLLFPGSSPVIYIRNLEDNLERVIQFSAVIITASATSLFVLGKRLEQLSLGLRNIIDIILDVDNYLRLHPKNDNPRTRIFSRYLSLLRYLSQETDSQNRPKYDAVIVVAHSQGTVITADLLRFIKKEKPQDLNRLFSSSQAEKIPVYFFSMGNPLRQLYSVGFPHLYNWVINYKDDYKDYGQDRLGNKPNPEDLGLEEWVNTFRSGDYIGRYLWRSSTANKKKLFKPSSSVEKTENISEKDKYREFCLGAGAHTQYWNATANRVADEINRLIDKATIS
jgi:hypothetical protein